MATPEPMLREVHDLHIHTQGETCPLCEQPISNERAKQVRVRMEEQDRLAVDDAKAKANLQIAAERQRLEADANAKIERVREESQRALHKLTADMDTRVETARIEGGKAVEAALQAKVIAAETAKAATERLATQKVATAVAEREDALSQVRALKVEQDTRVKEAVSDMQMALQAERATVEQVQKEREEALQKAATEKANEVEAAKAESRKAAEASYQERLRAAEQGKVKAEQSAAQRIGAAESATQQARAQIQELKDTEQTRLQEAVQRAREALEKDKNDAIGALMAAHDAEKRDFTGKLESMQRKLEKKRAEELGEGAEVHLFDALREEFPEDNIQRVKKGLSGADILHRVRCNGRSCGQIIYDSKNRAAWRDEYVAKLSRDQTAAKADHAILSTFKFPAGRSQLLVRNGVIVVNPARAVAVAQILRSHMVHVDTLRLSKTERTKKMAALYDFITSERCRHLLAKIDSEADALLKLQEAEITAHQKQWTKQGSLLRSIQKLKADMDIEIASILGADV